MAWFEGVFGGLGELGERGIRRGKGEWERGVGERGVGERESCV